MSAPSAVIAKPPSVEYNDNILFGARRDVRRHRESEKLSNESDCVLLAIGTYASKKHWSIKNIINNDKRLKSMFDNLDIKHALPIQRYSWPLLHDPNFPMLCVSQECSGKTYGHLLYVVAQSITNVSTSKTDELLMLHSDQFGLSPFQSNSQSKSKSDKTLIEEEIDHENFDFNQLRNGMSNLKLNDNDNNNNEAKNEIKTNGTSDHQTNGFTEDDGWTCDQADLDEFITHPKYLIVCSSQINVERIVSELESMKQAAYCDKASSQQRKLLPPSIRCINVHLTDETLALRCNESEILVGTPAALLRCFTNGYLNFAKCLKVIFDDLDVTLQLHNTNVLRLVNLFLSRGQQQNPPMSKTRECQMYMFSRKWTRLVKACGEYLSRQRNLLFGSLLEASIFANIRFSLELYSRDEEKLIKLAVLLSTLEGLTKTRSTVAIVCNTNQEASRFSAGLIAHGRHVAHLPQNDALKVLTSKRDPNMNSTYVMSDAVLELVADLLNNVTHVIHVTLPTRFSSFDQRFRLLYRNIMENKSDLEATIFIGSRLSNKYAKELYDLLSRSSSTLTSTKLELRDRIRQNATRICWRWATSGVCRLGQSTRGGKLIDDRLGSYCPNRHSITMKSDQNKLSESDNNWPKTGQVRLTITEIVSPNEFYFWFESYRDADSTGKQFTKFKDSGIEHMKHFQRDLDKLKNVAPNTVDLHRVKRGAVFGIYQQQELRVDRVVLLEDLLNPEDDYCDEMDGSTKVLNKKLEMSKVLEVFKIDYGTRQTARVSNLIMLPEELELTAPKCQRGFLIGLKPTDGEPDWLYPATKKFHELVSQNGLNDITAWLRLNSDGCFWFENMVVTWRVKFPDETKLFKIEPAKELILEHLAEENKSAPDCLNPSTYSYTMAKWNAADIASYASYAKPPRKLDPVQLMILFVEPDLTLKVRQSKFNKQLLRLEDELINDLNSNKLERLEYFERGFYCIAKTVTGIDPNTKEPHYILNRCKLANIEEKNGEELIYVDCLDHGDQQIVKREDLYQASMMHLSTLPFQAFSCGIADLNQGLLENVSTLVRVQNIIYDETRDSDDNYLNTTCIFTPVGNLQNIYVKSKDSNQLVSLIKKFELVFDIVLVSNKDPKLREDLKELDDDCPHEEDLDHARIPRSTDFLVTFILQRIAQEEYLLAQ